MRPLWFLGVLLALSGEATPPNPTHDGQVWLEGGTINGTGNVLVSHGGRWGIICDDGWSLNAAMVVCRSLGYPRALGHTVMAYFGQHGRDILLDNIQCFGNEASINQCRHNEWGVHDCDDREAAGVFCAPKSSMPPSTTTTTVPTTEETIVSTQYVKPKEDLFQREQELLHKLVPEPPKPMHAPHPYNIRLVGGRSEKEGRVEIRRSSRDRGRWGVICSDNWSLLEANVVCRQLGMGFAGSAVKADFFGGSNKEKVAAGIKCDGLEEKLHECFHEQSGRDTTCDTANLVAGVICTDELPDLVPNATLLERSTYLQDRPMYYLQCAMEENCASSSAFVIKNNSINWHVHRRRLLRFSSSTWNLGTADFRPHLNKQDWEWHMCHMHYHSMDVFAHYDLLDKNGNKVAEGHKASFCLEDVQCLPGVEKKFVCQGFGDQGISVGCADDYLHDIDCQWIDISDVPPGQYVFKIHVNPGYLVPELNFHNNAATCNLQYTGFAVQVTDCVIGKG